MGINKNIIFLQEEYNYKGSYSNLTYYIRKNNKRPKKSKSSPRFETDKDIIKVIEKITNKVNTKINPTTNANPIMLYQKEKEYLKPFSTNQIISNYLNFNIPVKVSNISLIYYKGTNTIMNEYLTYLFALFAFWYIGSSIYGIIL